MELKKIVVAGGDDINTPTGRVAAMLKKMIDEGKTGINAGEGYFKYE